MKSKCIVFTGPLKVEVRDEEVGDPGPGQVTIQARVSHISTGTESWCFRGQFDADSGWAQWVKYPFRPGYSSVGTIVRVGQGVSGLAEGDRVFSRSPHAEFWNSNTGPRDVVKLPAAADDESAAWSALSFITQTAVRHGEHILGDTAVVIGLGPLGQLVTQYLSVMGLREILVMDTVQSRLDLALAHGATQAFLGSAADALPFVQKNTEGLLADVVYDVTGHFSVLPLTFPLVRKHGKVVLLGDTPYPSKQHLTQAVIQKQIRICGTQNDFVPPAQGQWSLAREVLLFLHYVQRGKMNVRDMVTHRLRPADATTIYPQLQQDRGATMGVLFDWKSA